MSIDNRFNTTVVFASAFRRQALKIDSHENFPGPPRANGDPSGSDKNKRRMDFRLRGKDGEMTWND